MFLLLISQAWSQPKGKTTPIKTQSSAVKKTFSAEPWKELNTKEKLIEITTDQGVMMAKLDDITNSFSEYVMLLFKTAGSGIYGN